MNSLLDAPANKNNVQSTKNEVESLFIDFLEQNNIAYSSCDCLGAGKYIVDFKAEREFLKKTRSNRDIIVQTCNKDVCRIHPGEILYIAIEKRKSAVYIAGKRFETNYPLNFWKNILDPEIFAQPHCSFLVNLSYVEEVTKDFVKIKYKENKYSVYTSSRKINAFKKAFLNYNK